ncbi:MAG: methylmalonyl Co-A mutase-associated GTPase MeaB [Anaerolineae bacterium]|nr:methylmalonyl Co-A mutase-associated GTPase MeaB [Anaerolineae bacterium]HOV47363.1 methylmalonyl Co-A mutase-associated GTPase MeaB [Anaerolineae bacterium]HPD40279.1 methylmalonyl Co-A mutase-associated GTPase MeaB [Anaerolineae bacterium]HXK43003.1 methylmalonyl Co-A mutase-associated GTPase MeaB [Anaerolineae bacterium]
MQPLEAALAGDRRALARLLSWVENGAPEGREALATLFPRTGQAHVIGITGSPGAGKSTLVGKLARELRQRVPRLAIVAVDPSSPFSGGALLGDRLRMQDLAADAGIFIRSMASRGHPGGIAHATRDVVLLLDAVGFPVILVETVGAGQAQVEVARIAHTVILVEAPGMGDEVQALKAGLMEIADIIVVNKADRPEARQTVRALQSAYFGVTTTGHHGPRADEPLEVVAGWETPILQTAAIENQGLTELVEAIAAHRQYLESSGRWELLRRLHARAEVETWLQRHLMLALEEQVGEERLAAAVEAVLRREKDPATAAQELLAPLLKL